jgi:hypothetical protein
VREVNRKLLVAVASLFAISIMLTPLAAAKPWNLKNNDKFKTFYVEGSFSVAIIDAGDKRYIPSFDNVKMFIQTFEESMATYEITIDEETYTLADGDFTYSGHAKFVYYNPVFANPEKTIVESSSHTIDFVDYMYDFGDDGNGPDGTIKMRYVFNKGANNIFSLAGTGDLRNVNIKANAWFTLDYLTMPPTMNIFHEGIVSGWPE